MPSRLGIAGQEIITQRELADYIYLTNQIEELGRDLLARLTQGARTEEGIHAAHIEETWKRGKRVQKLKVR